ncbi:DUF2793 domain-containing protein [Microvirga roseola]|uniref:DUF2793 domain-containing protein n=1 Tax=Microvirga roseola TaxID=2883126 RepID=UPI001E58C83E|nr:DUF2793 domain-containing protein [Microvirga roseola]
MTATPHLALPLLAAAQAQKHVTHNEALAALDALVHLAVRERGRTAPPAAPEEGERYLFGAGATGAFANHEGDITFFDLGLWRFLAPRPGWRAYMEAEDRIVVFDGAQWRDLGHYSHDIDNLDRLGIGTSADDLNRFAAKLNSAPFAALATEEGGTGELRFVLNKAASTNVLSQLYQRGYSGRAETGLIGSDNFGIRVSSDGSLWRDAMLVDSETGVVSFPSGVSGLSGENLLINSAFLVNQRGFAGGLLSGSAYGFDRWKAGTGGCTLGRNADGSLTISGTLEQIVDAAQAGSATGAASFAGRTLTLSVENPSRALLVLIGTRSATIPAGTGRRSATVTLDAGETGHILVRLVSWEGCTFRNPKLEFGPGATDWTGEPAEIEEMRCRRYYQRLAVSGGAPVVFGALGQRIAGNMIDLVCPLPMPMRSAPALLTSGFTWANAPPVGNQIGFSDNGGSTWATIAGSLSVTNAAPSGSAAVALRLQAGASFGGTAGAVGKLYLGSSAYIALQAEL